MRAQEIDKENRHLREALADCNHDCKGKEVTIKLLRRKVKDYERKSELPEDHNKLNEDETEIKRLNEIKEEEQELEEDSTLELDTKLDEAEKKVAYLQSALESTESELYDLKSKYDDDSQTKSEEMEIIVNDLDRANQRAALAETEVRHLKEQLVAAKQSLQLADQIQKAPDMERAVDVVARSSLELELAAKQKEISQLLDDIQRLQSTLNTLKESSASKIAQLEELVNEKDRMIVELGEKLVKQQDYDDLKKELRYLKSVDFNNQKCRDDDVMKEGRKSLTPAAASENPFKVAKSENTGITTNCSSGMDVFGLTIGQDLVSAFPVTKEEKTSRPSTPLARLELDRKPSPSLDPTNCTLPATLPATNSSPEPSPTAKDMIISDTDKSSLEKLQEMMRHNIDKYANDTLNTLNISRCVRELLSVHNIGQRLFAKFVLGLSQGTVSELLSKPKPWDKLTEKGRDSYRKMHAWASDDHCIFMLKSLVPRRGKESGCGGPQTFKQDDQGAEERIVQILNEAQMAMMNAKQQQQQQQDHQRSPTLPNGSVHLSSTITDSRSMDSCEETRGENGDHKSSSNHSQSGNNLSGHNSRRSRKYENDDIPQEMVARIYQEELAKLVGQRVEEGFRNPPDQYERTQEEIRQALTIYHQELTRLSHLMPHQNHHHPNSFNPFVANGNTFAAALGQHHSIATTNGGSHHHHLPPQECPMDATVRSRTDSKTSSSRDEPELRHHGSAFSLVRPKTEPNTTSSNTITSSAGNTTAGTTHKSSSSSSGGMNAYRLHNSSPAPPPLLPLSEVTNPGSGPPSSGNTNGGGSNGGGTEDLTTSASPLQRMQSITNSLLSQTSVPSMPNPPQRPSKAVLPPITQQQFDQYNNLNTEDIVKKVKEQLSQYSISQRLFGESVLGLSQGSVSDLLARPKPWHMLTQKGREPFIRMKIFLEDDNAVHKLVASQYKIAPEKLMRTGGFSGASNPPGLPQFGTNKINSRPPDNHRITESRQTPVNNILYSPQNHQPRATCITPDTLPMSLTMNNTNPAISSSLVSRKQSSSSKGYSQPSVYEMAALTTDLDTQTITSKIKESLMAHNIGQKIFGEVVLGLSQGSVSELLSKPKPWHMLSIKGREPFIRMQMWLNDPHNIEMLQTIKNERREANKRRRTGEGPMDSPVSHSDNPLYGGYNFAPPSPYPPAKKPRVLFTEEQKEALRLAFTLDPYPSTATIEFLATELNLSVRTITNWFHNHRMRMKQHGVISPAGDEDSRKSSSEISSSSPGALVPVREGLAFDPIHYRVLLNQRLAEKFREKGGNNIGPPFLGNFGGSLPFLYSPYRNCSPLSSSGDDMGTLDLSMSSHMRHSVMTSGASTKMNDNGGGSSTDDRSNSEMNDDSNLSQDQPVTEGSDRDSPDDRVRPPTDLSNCRASPLRISPQRQQPPDQQQQQQARVPTMNSGSSSNRRKPAMPQWVDPGLELSPDSDVHTDDEEDDDENDEDNERIINGVCVRQAGNFNLLLPREETVHIVPVPAPDAMDASTHNINRHPKNSFKPQLQTSSTVSPPLASRTDDVSSRELSDNEPTVNEDEDDILNGCSKDDGEDPTKKDRCEDLAKKVFSDDGDDESWDDAAEAKDRRKNIEKLQQRLEKEDAGDDWEF